MIFLEQSRDLHSVSMHFMASNLLQLLHFGGS